MLAERTTAFTMGLRILERRLRNRLRFELGIAYEVEVDYYPVSESVAHAWIGADNGLSQPQQWFTETLALLDAMAADGPSEEELDVERAVRERAESDPGSWIPYLGWVAGEHLVGNPYLSRADAVREAREVTSEDVASAFGRARETLLVVTTDEVSEPPGFSQYPMFSTHRLEGRRHRPSGLRARLGRGERRELISSPDGISIVYPEHGAVTARYDATVLCIREGGVRTLLSDDGFFVPVDPEAWHGGAEVVAEIDAAVPDALVKSVDPAQDARAGAVDALVESTFKRTWLVSEELALLPSLLDDGESPLVLATASQGLEARAARRHRPPRAVPLRRRDEPLVHGRPGRRLRAPRREVEARAPRRRRLGEAHGRRRRRVRPRRSSGSSRPPL